MIIDDLLKMTDREVKKYIKSCGITKIEDMFNSKNVIEKLNLEDVGTIGPKKDIELLDKKAILKAYHRNQVNSLKISIYYNYAPDMPNTPAIELTLRLYNGTNGKLGVVHWEESYNGFIYKIKNDYFDANYPDDLYIWKVTKYSDYKRPWDYLEALKEERKSLDPLLTEATNALWNGELDSLFLMYTGEKINPYKNQFNASCDFVKMISLGSKNNLNLEDAFICFITEVLYEKQFCLGEFELVKKVIINYINNITGGYISDVTKYLDEMYSNKDCREYIRKILLSNVDKEILKHEALRRLEKQKEIISSEFGLDSEYFKIEICE